VSKSPSSRPADEPRLADPAPAATVIVLRDVAAGIQIFMVRRHTGSAFMPGADVFPGGRVDEGDREAAAERWCDGIAQAAAHLDDMHRHAAVAYHVAAVRELFEEAGILLARDRQGQFVRLDDAERQVRFRRHRREVHSGARSLREMLEAEGLRVALDALVPFAHWLTPPIDVRRFDTRFFVARMPSGQTPAHDDTETTHGAWVTPADALDRCRRGDTSLPVPTWITLRELEAFATVDHVLAWARGRRIQVCEPQLVERGERKWLVLPGDPLSSEPPREPPPAETRFELVEGRWLARSVTGSTTKDTRSNW
jgi:8-oxo-dGTP pyrophosphatase MutT (NUDIX family)